MKIQQDLLSRNTGFNWKKTWDFDVSFDSPLGRFYTFLFDLLMPNR